ncbi:MAG: hypothetical protein WBD16_14685 [Pyrinomonadaceae bacterium]
MTDNLDYEIYFGVKGSEFRLADSDIQLELVEVSEKKVTGVHEMFSLLFCGAKDEALSQGTYDLTHDTLGSVTLFLVPVGLDENGYRYEAAFNRLLST